MISLFTIIYYFFQLIAFIMEMAFLFAKGGLLLIVIGFFVFPLVWAVVPFWMLFEVGNWIPLAITLIPFFLMVFSKSDIED